MTIFHNWPGAKFETLILGSPPRNCTARADPPVSRGGGRTHVFKAAAFVLNEFRFTSREPTNSVFIKANALKFKDSLDLQNIRNIPRCKAASALAWPPKVVSDNGETNRRGGRNVHVQKTARRSKHEGPLWIRKRS